MGKNKRFGAGGRGVGQGDRTAIKMECVVGILGIGWWGEGEREG